MADIDRHLNWIWSPLRDLPLDSLVRGFSGKMDGERSPSLRVGQSFYQPSEEASRLPLPAQHCSLFVYPSCTDFAIQLLGILNLG